MAASKAEQVLEAMKTLLDTVPGAAVERNSVLPENVPAGGLVILRDGGVQASFDFRGAKNTAVGRMLTVTLTNDLDGLVYS